MELLRETALVGTEKKPLDATALPEAVKHLLSATDPETQFLQATTLLNFYKQAGTYPTAYKGVVDEAVIEEDKPVAPSELLDLYAKFGMVDYQIRDTMIGLWLNALIDQSAIVGPDILVGLIRDGQNASALTKAKILRVIGNKGAWILRNDSALSYPVLPSGAGSWEDGTTHERKILFANLHTQHPIEAIELLKRTWATESVVTKKVFLDLLKDDFVASDVSFAEACYNEEFKHQPKEKKTERECRRLLAEMLLSLTDTALYKNVTAALYAYHIKGKKGIMGFVTGKEAVSFQIPASEDSFWNAAHFEQAFGLESKSFDIALFNSPQLYWLSCLLEWIPMSYWAKHFDNDYERSIDYWLTNKDYQTIINGEVVPIFRKSLVENALKHRDPESAWILVNKINSAEVTSLLPVIRPEHFEAFIKRNKYWNDIEFLSNGPFSQERSWSRAFSEQVIEQAYDEAMRNKSSSHLGKVIAQFAHTESIDTLYSFNEKARESSSYNVWNTGIFQVAHVAMDIRNKINAIKK
ncbi:DUF5691 domain-containing protein [Chryseolinea sp. T2]|uniref:DUF5691 domain-containing protein n=1 Tax=Chryseolinea sp. T2 TaxID=3129255 RepID=UPI003076A729